MEVKTVKMEYCEKIKCAICGRTKEGFALRIRIGPFTIQRGLCQTCIAKMFRRLNRKK